MLRDPLEILGLAGNASKAEIKKRYRDLSKQCHPDHNQDDPDAATRFREVQRAYERISGNRTQRRGVEGAIEQRKNQRPSAQDMQEKPFSGFFNALRAYTERSRSLNRQETARQADNHLPDGED